MWSTSGHWSQIEISENAKQKAKLHDWRENRLFFLFLPPSSYVFPILWIRNYLTHLPRRRGRVGGSAQIWRPNPLVQPTVPSAQRPVSNPPLPTSAYKGNKWHKMFRTPEFYSARKKLAALCNPLYLGMKHLYKKRPPLWYGHFGAVFSCPGQLNRWPCHSLSKWVRSLLISSTSEHHRAVVDTSRHL